MSIDPRANPGHPVTDPSSGDSASALPRLTPAQVDRLRRGGGLRHVEAGDIVVEAGAESTHFFAVERGDHLENVLWRNAMTAEVESHPVRHLFLMTGATPNTAWLEGRVALDSDGFLKTGPTLTAHDLTAAKWPVARSPYLFETSLPGVFAVGDIRAGNVKRVASAVGEGSVAISFVHQVL